jgi:lysophospholipase L1-like esterase
MPGLPRPSDPYTPSFFANRDRDQCFSSGTEQERRKSMHVILCYGDSNTWGHIPVDGSDSPKKGRFGPNVRWTGVMREALGNEFSVIEEGLNGRTTVWDDPVRGGNKRNGSVYLLPCLESHSPIDLVVVMLGTNDLKARFAVTPYDIAESIGYLIEIVVRSGCGRDGGPCGILIVSPPPLGKLTSYAETFSGGVGKSRDLARHYERVARQYGCHFFDAGTVIGSSRVDGLHIDAEDHRTLGKTLAEKVPDILT